MKIRDERGAVMLESTYCILISIIVLMLCSDGFRHEITENEIYQYLNPNVMVDADGMKRNMDSLIDLNKQRQERDNISAVSIRTF